MKVVSLLPAATEMVCAIGAADTLVGISHECDFPPRLPDLPRLTRSRLRDMTGPGARRVRADLTMRSFHDE